METKIFDEHQKHLDELKTRERQKRKERLVQRASFTTTMAAMRKQALKDMDGACDHRCQNIGSLGDAMDNIDLNTFYRGRTGHVANLKRLYKEKLD